MIITLLAIAIFTLGVAVYKDAKLGVSPYDAIAPVVAEKTGWRYRNARLAQDILVILGAILLGGPIGITTFITGFMAGPFIEFFSRKVSQPMMENLALVFKTVKRESDANVECFVEFGVK